MGIRWAPGRSICNIATITTTQSGDVWCQCDCMFDITTKVMGLHLNKKYTFNVDGTKFDVKFDGETPISGVVTK